MKNKENNLTWKRKKKHKLKHLKMKIKLKKLKLVIRICNQEYLRLKKRQKRIVISNFKRMWQAIQIPRKKTKMNKQRRRRHQIKSMAR